MHHDQALIDADYELSERLGAEILAAGCEPVSDSPRAQAAVHFTEYALREGKCVARTGVDHG
jgi:hypothetical protein